MTVKELINILKMYPEDMRVAIDDYIYDDIEVTESTWVHNNYPYDKPDVTYVKLS